jgi:2-amino-4-hydroxy-6-hydroxymethyldihydropteridine diphosphokinase
MNDIYLLTGGNIGERFSYLQRANENIEALVGKIVRKSSVYETAPWGFTNQQSFLNQVLCVNTQLDPQQLLHAILEIEIQLGRKRIEKMGPRVIDIDILFYNNLVISSNELIIPHPRIAERRFVLTPLNEIAPNFIHPVYNKTVNALLQECKDLLEVNLYKEAE